MVVTHMADSQAWVPQHPASSPTLGPFSDIPTKGWFLYLLGVALCVGNRSIVFSALPGTEAPHPIPRQPWGASVSCCTVNRLLS